MNDCVLWIAGVNAANMAILEDVWNGSCETALSIAFNSKNFIEL